MDTEIIKALKSNKLFHKINTSEINLHDYLPELFSKKEGEIIFRDGDKSDAIFLVVSGAVKIVRKMFIGRGKSITIEDNDYFGEKELIDKTLRNSNAFALKDSYLIKISSELFEHFLNDYPEIKDQVSLRISDINKLIEEAENSLNEERKRKEIIEQNKFTDKEIPIVEEFVPKEEEIILELDEKLEESFIRDDELSLDDNLILDNSERDVSQIEQISDNIDESKFSDEHSINNEILSKVEEENLNEVIMENQPDENIILNGSIEEQNNIENTDDKDDSEEKEHIDDLQKQEIKELSQSEEKIKETYLSIEKLEIISRAADLVNSNLKIDDLLEKIASISIELTQADRGTIYLIDKEKNEIWSKVATGTTIQEIRLKLGEGAAGFCAKNNEIINIENTLEDDRFSHEIDIVSGYQTRNLLCFPVKNKEHEVIGVVQLLNSSNGKFSKIDESYLAYLSTIVALAIENAELLEKLLKSERVASLGKMTNFLIQDIKKPILVSKRYAEHLRQKDLPKENLQVLDMMLEQLNQVADLVQTTSNYSEGKSILRSINVGLNELLDDFEKRVESLLSQKNCKIVKDYDDEVIVKIDRKEFYQAYLQIIKNAADALTDGGTINITTRKGERSVSLKISDDGLGIPDSIKEKIFEPFISHGKKEGTGLGLAITKKIIDDHSGNIKVESNLGEGSTFIIELPLSAPF